MGINVELRKRPLRIVSDKDIKPNNLERVFVHYDERLKELDQRRIKQQQRVQAGSTTDETVNNILDALNNLIDVLNQSSLTED